MDVNELKDAENKNGNVNCLHNVGEFVYIGTTDGNVTLYKVSKEVSMETGDMKYTAKQLATQYLRAAKKVVDIKSDPALKILFIQFSKYQNDGGVNACRCLNFKIRIKEAQGLSVFCMDQKENLHRLAISVAKKIMLVAYTDTSYQVFNNIIIPEPALSMAWFGNTICVGLKKEYSMIKIDQVTDNVVTVLPLEKKIKPFMLLMNDEVLLRLTNLGVFVQMQGPRRCTASTRNSIAWSQTPNSIAISFPYVISLFPKKIEIYDVYSQMLTHTIKWIYDAKIMCGDRKAAFVSTQNKLFILTPISVEKQADKLIENGRCSEAFELVDKLFEGGPKEKEMLKMRMLEDAGFACLFDIQIKQSFEYFNDAHFDVCELLYFFPDLRPKNFIPHRRKKDNIAEDIEQQFINVLNKRKPDRLEDNIKEARKLVQETKRYLIHFLKQHRKPQKATTEQTELDFALVKLYIEIDDTPAIERLLSEFNNLDLKETETYLQSLGRHYFVGLLYKGKFQPDTALEIFKNIGTGVLNDEISAGKELTETIKILSDTDDKELIWKYSVWALEKDPESAIEIFTKKRKTPLPPESVLKFLTDIKESSFLTSRYLEFLIVTEQNTETKYHTQLAMKYIDSIIAEKHKLYRKSMIPKPAKPVRAGSEGGILGELRYKLLVHLSNSKHYHSESLLSRLVNTDLYEEMVILHSKLKQHRQALMILLYDLKDDKGAEKYCLVQSPSTGEGEDSYIQNPERSDLFCTLLDLCFNPPASKSKREKLGLYILNKHAKLIDPVKVLKLLPDSLYAIDINKFLREAILNVQHHQRDNAIISNISQVENVQTNVKLIESQKRRLVITAKRNCPLCNKSIANSVFAVYPDMTVVHFYCFDKLNKKKKKT